MRSFFFIVGNSIKTPPRTRARRPPCRLRQGTSTTLTNISTLPIHPTPYCIIITLDPQALELRNPHLKSNARTPNVLLWNSTREGRHQRLGTHFSPGLKPLPALQDPQQYRASVRGALCLSSLLLKPLQRRYTVHTTNRHISPVPLRVKKPRRALLSARGKLGVC